MWFYIIQNSRKEVGKFKKTSKVDVRSSNNYRWVDGEIGKYILTNNKYIVHELSHFVLFSNKYFFSYVNKDLKICRLQPLGYIDDVYKELLPASC